MKVKIKKLSPDAVIPSYAKEGDAGTDLTAIDIDDDEYGNIIYKTGLAIEIPEGYVGLLFTRSSNSKTDLILTNHVGVVDSGYRGEIIMKFRSLTSYVHPILLKDFRQVPNYKVGDRIGQIMIIPIPFITFTEVEELSASERGEGGFGSTNYAQQVSESPLHYKHNE